MSPAYRIHTGRCLLTQVLHILVTSKGQRTAGLFAALDAGFVALEHHNAVRGSCSDEGSAVAELRPFAVVVEEDVAERVADGGEEERDVADEPGELESLRCVSMSIWCCPLYLALCASHEAYLWAASYLGKIEQSLLKRLARSCGWRSHGALLC